MIWFLLILSALLLVLLLFPAGLLSVRKGAVDKMPDQTEENLRLYQERTDELAASDLEEEQKSALQLELDREFLANAGQPDTQSAVHPHSFHRRWPLVLAMLAVVLSGTVLLYQFWGASPALRATQLLDKAAQVELTQPERQELIQHLQAAAGKDPENIEWTYLYARMLNANGDFGKAAEVFADILVTLPEEATADRAATLTLLAQARFFAADQQADPDIYALLQESLQLQPDNRQAQGLAGMLAFELKDYRAAIEHWRVVWLSLADSPESQMLAQGITRAADRLQAEGDSVDLSWMKRAEIKVLVDLSDEAKADADPNDIVFVLARALSGPPMPLAVQKLTVAQLPQVVTLNDAQVMAAGMNLSSHERVSVVARLSKSGQPLPQSGDWQVEATPVAVKDSALVKLMINQRVP